MEGTFDKIASIGMFEQVGIRNHGDYFATMNRLLRPAGSTCTIASQGAPQRSDKRFLKMSPEYGRMGALHLSRRRTRSSGHVDFQSRTRGFRDPRRRGPGAKHLSPHDLYCGGKRPRRGRQGRGPRQPAGQRAPLYGRARKRCGCGCSISAGCSLAFARGGAYINQTLTSKRHQGRSWPCGSGRCPCPRADLYSR